MSTYRAPSSLANPSLGQGVQTLKNILAATDTVEADNDRQGPVQLTEQSYRMIAVTNEQTLRDELQLHFSAAFKSLDSGGDAALDFYKRTDYSSFALWFIATAELKFGGRKLATYALAPFAQKDLKRYGRERFYKRYGDSFVSEVRYGGQFSILCVAQCDTEEQFESMHASVSGHYGSFSSALDLQTALRSTVANAKVEFQSFITGYHGIAPSYMIGMDPAKRDAEFNNLIDFVTNFPTKVQADIDVGRPSIVYFSTTPMIQARGWPLDLDSDVEKASSALRDLAKLRDDASDLIGRLKYVLRNPGIFAQHESSTTTSALEQALIYCQEVDNIAQRVSDEPWSDINFSLPEFDKKKIENAIPQRLMLPKRPSVRVIWRLASMSDEQAPLSGLTNTGQPVGAAGFAGWVGDPDKQRQLTYISMALEPAIPGLKLKYFIGYQGAGNSGWVDEGTVCDARPNRSRIVQIGVDFDGPLGWYYKVQYYIRVIASQTIGPFGETKIASNGNGLMDPISGLWLSAESILPANDVTANLSMSHSISMLKD